MFVFDVFDVKYLTSNNENNWLVQALFLLVCFLVLFNHHKIPNEHSPSRKLYLGLSSLPSQPFWCEGPMNSVQFISWLASLVMMYWNRNLQENEDIANTKNVITFIAFLFLHIVVLIKNKKNMLQIISQVSRLPGPHTLFLSFLITSIQDWIFTQI